jgi:hypothetical protein
MAAIQGAFGDPNIVNGNESYAFGDNNSIGDLPVGTNGNQTFVLGNNVTTTANNAVILGNDSSSKDKNGIERNDTVSVGATGKERQIIHVKAGEQDTDAVNVKQLNDAKTRYYSVNSTDTSTGSNFNNDGATGVNALAVGVKSSAFSENSSALGYNNLIYSGGKNASAIRCK